MANCAHACTRVCVCTRVHMFMCTDARVPHAESASGMRGERTEGVLGGRSGVQRPLQAVGAECTSPGPSLCLTQRSLELPKSDSFRQKTQKQP